jgi:outer membrane protein assembly factor BamB
MLRGAAKSCILAAWLLAAASVPLFAGVTGGLEWSYAAPHTILFAPTVAPDGTSYIATGDQRVRAIGPSGNVKWAVEPGGLPTTGIALQGGLLLFGTSQEQLAAYRTNGTMVWRVPMDDIMVSTPAVGADGVIYAASRKGTVYAVSPAGRVVWTFPALDDVVFSPAVALSGRIYVASTRRIFGLDADGAATWIWVLASPPASQMAIDSEDGLSYVDAAGTLHHLDASGNETWNADVSTAAVSPVASADTVLVCQGAEAPPPSGHSISGKVVAADTGEPLAGVEISAGSATAVTGSNGKYKLRFLANGTYTLTPSLSGYSFHPILKNVIVKDADVAGVKFKAASEGGGGLAAPPGPCAEGAAGSPEDEIASLVTGFDAATGDTSWTADVGAPYAMSLVSGGSALVPGSDYNIYLVDSAGDISKTIPFDQAPQDVVLAATDRGSRIYVVGGDRYLFCVSTVCELDGTAPWSQLGASPRHVSRREQ